MCAPARPPRTPAVTSIPVRPTPVRGPVAPVGRPADGPAAPPTGSRAGVRIPVPMYGRRSLGQTPAMTDTPVRVGPSGAKDAPPAPPLVPGAFR
ncbi:hypothetical protein GCM10010519_58260 [Streptomyces lactacystinicus]